MNLSFGSIRFALSYCDFHSRTLWHTTLHTWSTFLIVKKPDDITVLKEEKKILCIVFFMTFLKYFFPGPFIKATQNFQGIFNFFAVLKQTYFRKEITSSPWLGVGLELDLSWPGVGCELDWSWPGVGCELAGCWLRVGLELSGSWLEVAKELAGTWLGVAGCWLRVCWELVGT